VSDTDQALHALLRLQKRLIGRGSGASCCTDVKIVKIREDFKTIKDTLANLVAERDEARREVCFLLSRNVTQGCDGDTPEFHATARGWCYLLEEDDE
jgi:hypothetical protein